MKKLIDQNDTETFGERLIKLRKSKGMTQTELGKMLGVSKRVICYYEKATKHPPASKLGLLSKALNISVDELLGIKKTFGQNTLTKNKKILKRLKVIDQLPPSDQKAIIQYIDLLLIKQKIKKHPNESITQTLKDK